MRWVGLFLFFLNVPSSHAVTLIYSNDVMGELEPCGCRSNPLGGMLRKMTLINSLKDPVVIQLDAGDLLFSTTSYPELLKEQARVQAEYLLKSIDLTLPSKTFDFVSVPGEKDFALGVKTFTELIRKSKAQFLAANLTYKSGKSFLKSEVLLLRKTPDGKIIKILVFGLVGKNLHWPKELKVLSVLETAKKEIIKWRSQADLIVALTHQGLEEDEKMAKLTSGIDVIVGAHSQSFLQIPSKIKNTLIYQSSFRNQYVGVIPLKLPFRGEGHELVGLDEGYEKPNSQTPLIAEFKVAIAKINAKKDLRMVTSSNGQLNAKEKFQTFPRCAECHLLQFDFWRKTRHGSAYASLVEKKQDQNFECLKCHSLGLGDEEGFKSLSHLSVLKAEGEIFSKDELGAYLKSMHELKSLNEKIKISNAETLPLKQSLSLYFKIWPTVQCENCHMPGRDHPFSGSYSKVVEKSLCLTCHTQERAPAWYLKNGQPDLAKIDLKRREITCPRGELVE